MIIIEQFKQQQQQECFEAHPNTNEQPCITRWINDGFCDDECNFPHHNYDGADCCLPVVLGYYFSYCSKCFCYQDCSKQHFTQECFEPDTNYINTTIQPECSNWNWIKDGFCDDVCNFPQFGYDGGDCCLETLVSTYCSDCFCYQSCSQLNPELIPYDKVKKF